MRVGSAVPMAVSVSTERMAREELTDVVVVEGVLVAATPSMVTVSKPVLTHADGHHSRGYRDAAARMTREVAVSRRRLSLVGAVMVGTAKAGLAVALVVLAVILELSGGGQ